MEESLFFIFYIAGSYILGSLIMIPIILLIGATAMVFAPLKGGLYALIGCLSSAIVSYSIGAYLGKQFVRRIGGAKMNSLGKILAKQGLLTMIIVRNLPLAPFTIVNMVAGASRIRFKDYFLGTALGMVPGILVISMIADRLTLTVKYPNWENILITIGLIIAMVIGIWWTKKRITQSGTR
jgi:uncharacterized membrane protein YdjX (TVP38/TMEM64 family)